MKIREERSSDIDIIWNLNSMVFETEAEANLVNALRNSGCTYLSLVADIAGKVVGHIFFSPVELTGNKNNLKIMGLAPMAVLSEFQNRGIGTKLVRTGLAYCKARAYDAAVVLGHPTYYPRFGFVPSVNFDIKSEYDVPDDVFMIQALRTGALKHHRGIIKYQQAFNQV